MRSFKSLSCLRQASCFGSTQKLNKFRCFQLASITTWENNISKSTIPAYPADSEHLIGANLTDFVLRDFKNFEKSKVAIACGTTGDERTYGDLESDIEAIATGLKSLNTLKKGSTVALISPNHVDYFSALHGSFRLGCVVSPFNPLYTEYEIVSQLEKCSAEVVIVHPDIEPTLAKALSRPGHNVKHVITLDKEISDWRKIHAGSKVDRSLQGSGSDVALLPYSSGTTGVPKGTMLSHDNLIVNIVQGRVEFDHWDTDNDVILSPLPMFHIYGFLVSLHFPIVKGLTYVTLKSFDLEKYCKLVEKYKCTRTHIVPPIALALAKAPTVDNYDMSSLKIGISAAAPLGAELVKEVDDRLGLKIKQAWGMSELSPIGTLSLDEHIGQVDAGTVGPVVPGTEAMIADITTGQALPPGSEGELWIRGPQVMLGYLNEPEKTAECLTSDGWLKTGDIAKIDEDGNIFITDRMKELIKFKGFQVAPAELEAVVCTHPGVQDATVIPRQGK